MRSMDPAVHQQLEAMPVHLDMFATKLNMLHKGPAVYKQLEAMFGHLEP